MLKSLLDPLDLTRSIYQSSGPNCYEAAINPPTQLPSVQYRLYLSFPLPLTLSESPLLLLIRSLTCPEDNTESERRGEKGREGEVEGGRSRRSSYFASQGEGEKESLSLPANQHRRAPSTRTTVGSSQVSLPRSCVRRTFKV